ncbi:DNA directed RNA polymerase subunit delta [Williamsoniiplasma luminosum]|uniref:RNAP delta factor n=2 Tax=Williamsoniiplasma luminosum TaxID=214888 RepID=A0A2K8NT02_9MOLU|nr:DNA-directed RNA polymerase subunit delta [Williamsoniiplasma luminosum]ATZ16960.1 DNA directed RNA polymerase subunit delta [Williamsoniiplasma luminosum]AVP49629.1 MAG: DNA-directed RNA polymerase subunit delta [Williamsoniiplasma luminosum]
MSKLSNIDLAYEFLQEKKTPVKFNEIWKNISKKQVQEHQDLNAVMANLYASLITDNRFALAQDGSWALSSNMKIDDVKKQYDNLNTIRSVQASAIEDENLTFYGAIDEEEEEDYEPEEDDFGDGDIEE